MHPTRILASGLLTLTLMSMGLSPLSAGGDATAALPGTVAGQADPGWTPGKGLRMSFSGDIMAHTQNFERKPYAAIYASIKYLLDDADLNFANFEFPIDDQAPYASFPLFNVHSEYARAALDAGFNVVSLANNHSADRGRAGMQRTVQAMQALAEAMRKETGRRISFNGLKPGDSDPAFSLERLELNGLKVGFVALAEWVNETKHTRWVQHYGGYDEKQGQALLDWIAEVRPGLDILVLSYHWGDEYQFLQTKRRAAFSKKLVEAGVDILWGNHPHVLQQWYLLDSPRGQALVMPSLGNFISAQSWSVGPGRKDSIDAAKGNSLLFKLECALDKAGKLSFTELSPVLIANWKNPQGQMVVRSFGDLLGSEKGEWLAFWKYRYGVMSSFIKDSSQATTRYLVSD